MASGHVNRTQRPNTWLHRPSLRREESSCQLGAVHTWPFSTKIEVRFDVRYWGVGGHQDLSVLGTLEDQERLGNFGIQDLLNRFNAAKTLACNVRKKGDDT